MQSPDFQQNLKLADLFSSVDDRQPIQQMRPPPLTERTATSIKEVDQNAIYMNVVLVDAFKEVYRLLDVQKKGYIKLKDLVLFPSINLLCRVKL